jgi:hypothetical protein
LAPDDAGSEADLEVPERASKPEGWDADRVARHIERAAAQAYQAYRRARWLRLLHDCEIVYQEPDSPRARWLLIRDGELASASDAELERAPSSPVRSLGRSEPLHFDRSKYDRLRVLSSELKRIARDGGRVSVHWASGRQPPARLLAGVLRLV